MSCCECFEVRFDAILSFHATNLSRWTNTPLLDLLDYVLEWKWIEIPELVLLQVLSDLFVGDIPIGLRNVDGLLDGHGPLARQDPVEDVVVALLDDVAHHQLVPLFLQLDQDPVVGVVDDCQENILKIRIQTEWYNDTK